MSFTVWACGSHRVEGRWGLNALWGLAREQESPCVTMLPDIGLAQDWQHQTYLMYEQEVVTLDITETRRPSLLTCRCIRKEMQFRNDLSRSCWPRTALRTHSGALWYWTGYRTVVQISKPDASYIVEQREKCIIQYKWSHLSTDYTLIKKYIKN